MVTTGKHSDGYYLLLQTAAWEEYATTAILSVNWNSRRILLRMLIGLSNNLKRFYTIEIYGGNQDCNQVIY